jgi:hypothetical protein
MSLSVIDVQRNEAALSKGAPKARPGDRVGANLSSVRGYQELENIAMHCGRLGLYPEARISLEKMATWI